MNTLTVLLFTILVQTTATAQPLSGPEKGWRRIYIKDVGHFDLPKTLEIPTGKYKAFADKENGITGYDTNTFSAQELQSKSDKTTFSVAANITLETTISAEGDYRKLDSNKSFSQKEIEDLNTLTRKALQGNPDNGKITEWSAMKAATVNGLPSMHFSYKRQLPGKPTEIVHKYVFYNNDRMHELEFSHGINQVKWKDEFGKVLNSFRITNIR